MDTKMYKQYLISSNQQAYINQSGAFSNEIILYNT